MRTVLVMYFLYSVVAPVCAEETSADLGKSQNPSRIETSNPPQYLSRLGYPPESDGFELLSNAHGTISCGTIAATFHAPSPIGLTCESRTDPADVALAQPLLGWVTKSENPRFKQSAYQIAVAPSLEQLFDGKDSLWDSGRVTSSQSRKILYEGKPLTPGRTYYWRVRVWDAAAYDMAKKDSTAAIPTGFDAGAGLWSAPAKWTMAEHLTSNILEK